MPYVVVLVASNCFFSGASWLAWIPLAAALAAFLAAHENALAGWPSTLQAAHLAEVCGQSHPLAYLQSYTGHECLSVVWSYVTSHRRRGFGCSRILCVPTRST